jgi:WD40 repeat protein
MTSGFFCPKKNYHSQVQHYHSQDTIVKPTRSNSYLHQQNIYNMKKIYTALVALGLALGANAQTPIYTLDSTFNADGIAGFGAAGNLSAEGTGVNFNLNGIWVAGKIVTAGGANTSHFVSRFLNNGTLDNTFATNGTAAFTASGNIPSAIRDLHALRYSSVYAAFSGGGGFQSSGATLQNYTYGSNPTGTGVYSTARMNDSLVVFLSGSQIEVMKGGVSYSSFPWFNNLSHYGSLPVTVDGLASVSYQKVAAQSDGKILLAGDAGSGSHLFIIRLKNKETYELDSTFGTNGVVKYIKGNQVPIRDVSCLQVYPDGDNRIVLGYGNFIYRFSANGTKDNTFNTQLTDNDEAFTRIAFSPYNDVVAIGKTSTTSALYAFKNDGSPLNSFHKGKNTYLKTDADVNLNAMDLLDVKIDAGANIYVSGSMKETSTSDPKVLIMKLKVSLCTEPSVAIDEKAGAADFVIFNAVRPTVVVIRDGDGIDVVNDTIKTGTGNASVSYSNLGLNTTYSYIVANPDGCSSTGVFTTLASNPTSINDLNNDKHVVLYPNPSKSTLNISSEITFDAIEISNVLGAVVKAEALSNNSINIAELQPGVYFAKLIDSKGAITTKKFIKQ